MMKRDLENQFKQGGSIEQLYMTISRGMGDVVTVGMILMTLTAFALGHRNMCGLLCILTIIHDIYNENKS